MPGPYGVRTAAEVGGGRRRACMRLYGRPPAPAASHSYCRRRPARHMERIWTPANAAREAARGWSHEARHAARAADWSAAWAAEAFRSAGAWGAGPELAADAQAAAADAKAAAAAWSAAAERAAAATGAAADAAESVNVRPPAYIV